MNELDLYDIELVRNKLQELFQQKRSIRDITFYMRIDLDRNPSNFFSFFPFKIFNLG